MRRARLRTLLVAAVVLLVSALAGCRTNGLEFGRYQLRILSPEANSTVTAPLRLTWTAGNLFQPGDSYAVFVDTQPIGPGRNVTDLLPAECKVLPDCDKLSYYEQANVWLTNKPSLVLQYLPDSSIAGNGKEYHTITVVILNQAQVRIGEEYATVDIASAQPSG
jgi:hypothetical protein